MKHLNNQSGSILIGVVVVLGLVYAFLFFLGRSGWGYAGYHGYRPSYWYWGGPRVYSDPSVRTGSRGGPGHVGGGPGAGK